MDHFLTSLGRLSSKLQEERIVQSFPRLVLNTFGVKRPVTTGKVVRMSELSDKSINLSFSSNKSVKITDLDDLDLNELDVVTSAIEKQAYEETISLFEHYNLDSTVITEPPYTGENILSKSFTSNCSNASLANPAETLIKVKILLPKGALNNEDVRNAKNLIENNVLNIINDISKSNNLQNNSEADNTFVISKLKESCKVNVNDACIFEENRSEPLSPIFSHDSKTPELKDYAVTELINNSHNYASTVDKNALLAKANALNAQNNNNSDDGEIVKDLVLDRYNIFLNSYYQRSFKRSISRRTSTGEDTNFSEFAINSSLLSLYRSAVPDNELTYVLTSEDSSLGNRGQEETKSNLSEYDADAFLRVALGDENYGNCDDSLNSSPKSDRSVATTDISSLISRTSSFYSGISKKLHKLKKSSATFTCNKDRKLSDLVQECAVQKQVMLQISKVLDLCKKTKEFAFGVEHVEAERLLLLATYRRETLLEEIRQTENEEVPGENPAHLGYISISNLKFPHKHNNMVENDDGLRCKEYNQWFVCVLSYGTVVLASDAMMANLHGGADFQQNFVFENLPSDFELNISIYSLRIRSTIRNYSHESKFHLNKETTTCPSPKKILQLRKVSSTHKLFNADYKETSFTLWGKTTLRVADVCTTGSLNMSNVALRSTLDGTFTMQISSGVKISEKHSGFLTIGTEINGSTVWNRRWCCLNGSNLDYWNYPYQESSQAPLGSMDLEYCVTAWISAADRVLCARPRTLLLETARVSDKEDARSSQIVIIRHFLAADSNSEMKEWESRLNSVVNCLRNWNCMKCQLFFKHD